jgi:hypothetical protein
MLSFPEPRRNGFSKVKDSVWHTHTTLPGKRYSAPLLIFDFVLCQQMITALLARITIRLMLLTQFDCRSFFTSVHADETHIFSI